MKIIEFSFDADIVKTYQKHKVKKDKKIKEGDFIIEGYVMTSDIDCENTIITKEAIKKSKNDLIKYSTVLFNHDMDRPIGRILETDFDDKGLWVKMKLSNSEVEIREKVQEGIISKFSIKGRVLKESVDEIKDKKSKKSNPEEDSSENNFIRKIDRLELYEASLVSIPANAHAKTINWYIAKALEMEDKKSDKNIKKDKIKKTITHHSKKKDEIIDSKKMNKKNKKEVKKVLNKDKKEVEKSTKKLSTIEQLKGLSSRLKKDESKKLIDKTINILEKVKKNAYKHDEKVLGLSDESKNVYEFNSNDAIELDGNKFRKQVLKTGKWYHWDAEGGVLKIDKNSIDSLVKNFKDKTIEHVYVPLTHTNDPIKNAGEVVDLIPTEDGLDAVCEIKDEKVAKRIKDGLIKCVSASIDENYMKKDTGDYVGPTLLHTALVAEPYIKGMRGFTELSDELSDKKVVALSDVEPTINDMMNMFKRSLLDRFKKEINKLKKKNKKTKKTSKDKKIKKQIKKEEKKMEDKKVKSLEEKPEEVKAKSGDRSEAVVSKKEKGVDLAEAERVYQEYLEKGKVVPTQKDVLISLLTSKSKVNLGDDEQVGIKKALTSFLENQPKVVDFSEKGTQNKGIKENKKKDGEIPSDVKEFYGNMGLNNEQIKDAWKFAQVEAKKVEKEKSTLF